MVVPALCPGQSNSGSVVDRNAYATTGSDPTEGACELFKFITIQTKAIQLLRVVVGVKARTFPKARLLDSLRGGRPVVVSIDTASRSACLDVAHAPPSL